MKRRASFLPLFATNFCGVANDNFLKTLAGFVLIGWVEDVRTRTVLMGITAASLVLPYILFSPLADRLTALFSKCRIVRLAKFAELPIVALAVIGFALQSAAIVVAAIVLMGLQSSLFSPAKYALIRDIGGTGRISTGMGGMESVSFLGVLGGTIAASFVADLTDARVGYAILIGLALCGLALCFTLHATEERNREIHSVNPIRFLRRARRMAHRYPGLDDVIAALCLFWATAAMLQQGLIIYGTQVLGLDSAHTGVLLILAAVGIVVGQLLAGWLDRGATLIALAPLFGIIGAALLTAMFAIPMSPVAFGAVLSALAFDLGLFKLPLESEIQRLVKGTRLNTILAYFNQISFLHMFLASVAYAVIGWLCGPRAFFPVIALAMVVATLRVGFGNRRAMMALGAPLFRPRYRIVADALPAGSGPLLVLPNHPALIDPMLVLFAYRATDLRPLVDAAFFESRFFGRVLETVNAVPVPDLRGRHTAADVAQVRGLHALVLDALRGGDNVVLYPSGHIYIDNRENIGNRQLAYTVCRDLPDGVTVVALRTEGLWGSIWSRKGRTASPSFALTLLKGAALWPLSPFRRRRTVTIHAEDLTAQLREWSRLTRREFNDRLTAWYNRE